MNKTSGQAAKTPNHLSAEPLRQRQPAAYATEDARPEALAQRKLAAAIHDSPRMVAQRKLAQTLQSGPQKPLQRQSAPEEETLQGKWQVAQRQEDESLMQAKEARSPSASREPATPNRSGLPDRLKNGIESLSGMSLDTVRVHYNSPRPAQLNAHAYAQGTDIHVAPGQEQHLPHEAWHVVQQAQGRVGATRQMKDGVPINDDAGLEREADVMGARALSEKPVQGKSITSTSINNKTTPMQFTISVENTANVWGDLFALRGGLPSKTEQKIFKNWHASPTEHKFSSLVKLSQALTDAETTRTSEPGTFTIASKGLPDPPALFRAANLRFLTSTGGARLATLYFNDNALSARVRQQHGSGPLVQEPRSGKVDYFGDSGELDQIKNKAKSEQKKDLNQRGFEMVRDIIHADHQANEAFQVGKNHLEIWYDDAGNYVNNHQSQGTAAANPGYTDKDIKIIYSKVVGRLP